MLSVVTFKWSQPNYRSKFTADHVNTLERMVRRNYAREMRFICVSDTPKGLSPHIHYVPLWDDFSSMVSPHGDNYPSCYRRLKIFDPEIRDVLGERFVAIDLDTVVTGDLTKMWSRTEDFVIWGGTNPTTKYNGSMMLMSAGARPDVWSKFDPVESPKLAGRARCWGSDQGWISYILGPNQPMFTKADGVYSYRNDIRDQGGRLPAGARMVCFHGKEDPWDPGPQGCDWVQEHYK